MCPEASLGSEVSVKLEPPHVASYGGSTLKQSDTNTEKCMQTPSLQEVQQRGESLNEVRRAPHKV